MTPMTHLLLNLTLNAAQLTIEKARERLQEEAAKRPHVDLGGFKSRERADWAARMLARAVADGSLGIDDILGLPLGADWEMVVADAMEAVAEERAKAAAAVAGEPYVEGLADELLAMKVYAEAAMEKESIDMSAEELRRTELGDALAQGLQQLLQVHDYNEASLLGSLHILEGEGEFGQVLAAFVRSELGEEPELPPEDSGLPPHTDEVVFGDDPPTTIQQPDQGQEQDHESQ